MTDVAEPNPFVLEEGDKELLDEIAAAKWKRSPGYARKDGELVGPHEYIVRFNEPELFEKLRQRIGGPGSYKGKYKGYTYKYLNLPDPDGNIWQYWANRIILNRSRIERQSATESEPKVPG